MRFTGCRRRSVPPPPQRWPARLALVLGVVTLCGCSTEAWYESAKRSAEAQCRQQSPGAIDACMARINPSRYDTYEKERAKAQ